MTARKISLKPRKLPGQRRATATVETIIEAAARILETEGLAGYNTNAVAARAGVSIGSLYQYFPNRDAITRALIERERAMLVTDLESAASGEEGRAALRRLLTVAVRQQLRRPALARLLDLEESRLPVAESLRSSAERGVALLRACLAGIVDSPVAGVTVGDVMAIVRGMVDAAGQRNETDEAALLLRVEWAVFGYLIHASGRKRLTWPVP